MALRKLATFETSGLVLTIDPKYVDWRRVHEDRRRLSPTIPVPESGAPAPSCHTDPGAPFVPFVPFVPGGSPIANITGPSGSGELQSTTLDLSSADLLAIVETPLQLVATPGAGKIILIQSLAFQVNPGLTPYVDSGGFNFTLLYGSGPEAVAGPNFTGFLTSATIEVLTQNGFTGATWVLLDPATAANQPIMLTATGDPTLGNGTVRVRAWYVVHDTTLPS